MDMNIATETLWDMYAQSLFRCVASGDPRQSGHQQAGQPTLALGFRCVAFRMHESTARSSVSRVENHILRPECSPGSSGSAVLSGPYFFSSFGEDVSVRVYAATTHVLKPASASSYLIPECGKVKLHPKRSGVSGLGSPCSSDRNNFKPHFLDLNHSASPDFHPQQLQSFSRTEIRLSFYADLKIYICCEFLWNSDGGLRTSTGG
ncbi:hypothetical protein Baya_16515 [Bagarius yarrelli]|uniref:Uncharacterized protein n=1 Tax=Bagarius yarrelli TaxID=175774 RepID=A0A556VVT2_BAGYA|nr:hypothetical protein Baya_16515 [Bagarius yarrelli]